MPDKPKLIPRDTYATQINAYAEEHKEYEVYEKALGEVLRKACGFSAPEALVQTRAKTISSFAEKCARKYDKYKDAVNDFTDLCGARVIVQTLEQVQAVRNFIEANFEILEKEDKGLLLQPDEFGYRDMHYIVRLRLDRDVGFTEEQRRRIGRRRAEIQVRTWVQHAWADTLHDRMYKARVALSPEIKRTGALLAAIMEDGDRTFSRLSREIDGIAVNYSEYAPKGDVENEIRIQNLLLESELDSSRRILLALQVSRLLAASGEYRQVAELLGRKEFKEAGGALGCEIRLHLGSALCKAHRAATENPDFDEGLHLLEGVIKDCECADICEVPNMRRQQNVVARAHACLGWAHARRQGAINSAPRARFHYQSALECEPQNPYYLADVIGYEIYCTQRSDLAGSMRAALLEAIQTCRDHALRNTEMPYACFTAGRLNLLLGSCTDPMRPKATRVRGYEALGWYARGVRHCLAGKYVVPPEAPEAETEWMLRVNAVVPLPREYLWSLELLDIASQVGGRRLLSGNGPGRERPPGLKIAAPVLVVAGGAASMSGDTVARVRPIVSAALEKVTGTVISGGTDIGVPGCVGDVANQLERESKKGFSLVGYVKERFTEDAPRHGAYNDLYKHGSDFSPEHVLQGWRDILSVGILPEKVVLLGFGGGPLSAAEYQIGVALGASVGVVTGTGGAADALAADPLWAKLLYPLPFDWSTIRAFVVPAKTDFDDKPAVLEDMARGLHERYLVGSAKRLPPGMQPWEKLDETYKVANLEQAKYAIDILAAAGFEVRPAAGKPVVFKFGKADLEELELMAEMEHGRWNVERLRDGWRFGKFRDDSQKKHNCIVPWEILPADIKPFDRDSVKAFPEIIAKAGFEIVRLDTSNKGNDNKK